MGDSVDPKTVIESVVDGGATPTDPVVSKKEFDALLKENLKRKDALNAAEKEKAELKKLVELAQTEKMKSKEMWKEIAETKEKEVETLRSENSQIKKAVVDASKHAALKAAVQKLGLHPSAEKYIDTSTWLDEVEVEYTSTGRVNVLNVDAVAQNFKAQNPLLFQAPTAPGINTTSPQVVQNGGGSITVDQLTLLSKKYNETKNPTDLRNYQNAVLAFKSQQRA